MDHICLARHLAMTRLGQQLALHIAKHANHPTCLQTLQTMPKTGMTVVHCCRKRLGAVTPPSCLSPVPLLGAIVLPPVAAAPWALPQLLRHLLLLSPLQLHQHLSLCQQLQLVLTPLPMTHSPVLNWSVPGSAMVFLLMQLLSLSPSLSLSLPLSLLQSLLLL